MSLRIKEKVKKIRRSLSWHTTSPDVVDHLDGLRGSISHSSNNSFDQSGLPEVWESAIDKDGRLYYINHKENVSTYNDPRRQLDVEYEYAETRIVTLLRDAQLGFGFVAGSERPVVVRCVSEDGPSDSSLLPGDQIHKIYSEDVRDAPRSRVIELVRSAEAELVLTVSQPPSISTQGKKSILLNAAKKQQRLKRDFSASRVRFCEDSLSKKKRSTFSGDGGSHEGQLSNVLKVRIEMNQTRSFKYDGFTLVKDVLHSLQEKLDIRCIEHFGLVLHNVKSPLSAKMTILSNQEKIKQVVEDLSVDHMQCLFRIVFVPRDAYDLLRKDSIAFQYFYTQCCQDVINERFSSDLKCDVALRLASLHMQEQAIEKQIPFQKISIKLIEREFGLGMFLNPSMLQAVRPKELRKMLTHFMKLNQGLIAPGQKQVTPLQAKLHYMKIVSELRSFGGKCFLATLVDRHAEVMLLVGPKCGISQVTDIKSFTLHMLADFDLIELITVEPEASGATQLVSVLLTDKNLPTLGLSMMNTDAKDFLIFVQGYHNLFCGAADLIKYQAKADAMRCSNISKLHTPPLLAKTTTFDYNKNETVEPDYATIEDVLHPVVASPSKGKITPSKLVFPAVSEELRPKSAPATAPVIVCDVIVAADTNSSKANHVADSTNKKQFGLTNGSPAHHYDITADDSDCTPPMSSIDDLIQDSSPDGSISTPRDSVPESNMEGLTDECINELNKLDNAGVLLDPRLFKDKGLYLNPQASSIDLSVLPPPPDEMTLPISPPPVIPPPPPLFTDERSEMDRQTDQAIGAQMQAVVAINVQDTGDKESGIDSDDSGTETFNSTDNVSNIPQQQSAINIVSVPQSRSQQPRVSVSQSSNDNNTQVQMPASSLRSRIQEQRAKAKLLAESLNIEQTPVFASPVKPDPIIFTSSLPNRTQPTPKPDPIISTSSLPNRTQPTPKPDPIIPTSSLPNRTQPTPKPPLSNSSIMHTESIVQVQEAEEKQADIDSRMVDALMQFTNELSTDTESTDGSDNEADNGSILEVNDSSKPLSALPPVMLDDSHVEVSTEEEDDDSLNNNPEAEPVYMNSEIGILVPTRVPSDEHKRTAAAIDEALDGLSSESDCEVEPTAAGSSLIVTKYSDSITLSSDSTTLTGDSSANLTKRSSATILIHGSAVNNAAVASGPVTGNPVTSEEATDSTPKPPPRRRKGLKGSSSMTSLLEADRPSSRTSIVTVSSIATTDADSPRSVNLSQASLTKTNSSVYNRSISATSSLLSEPNTDRLSLSGASINSWSSSGQGHPSFNPVSQTKNNPISKDLSMLRAKNSKRSKHDRASVIGMPTNITCTAGDVLANCIPISRDSKSPQSTPRTSLQSKSSVTLTSRESLLEEIVKNAQGMGIDTLGLVGTDEVEAGVRRRSHMHHRSSNQDSIRSTNSSGSTHSRSHRPGAPPPPPPSKSSPRVSAMKASHSEGDLLAATYASLSLQVTDDKEAMLEVEYTTLDNKTSQNASSRLSTASSDRQQSPAASATRTSLSRQDSALNSNSGLEKDGSFIKFSGYSGAPSVSPSVSRRGRYKKKNTPTSLISDDVIGESQQSKRGIMAKILNTIKPKKRSMSLDRLTIDAAGSRKQHGGSLKSTSIVSRPTILPNENKRSRQQRQSSEGFRSFGKTKFHSKPKLSLSLSELVFDPEKEGIGTAPSSLYNGRSQSVECLQDSKIGSPVSQEAEEEVEELLTSGSKITPSGILNYTYDSHNAFEEATSHTQTLMEYFTTYCDTQWAPSLKPDPHNFTKHIETLVSDGRQFVSNSKQLVAGVAQASSPADSVLVSKMAASMRTLAKIIRKGVEALKVATSEYNMASLRECIITLTEAYADVLQTSHKAAGKTIRDENMMMIMQKASHLASLLSLFLKTLRSLHESE